MLRMGGEKIFIFDLDGTLADDRARAFHLHPKHRAGCLPAYGTDGTCVCGVKRDWDSYFAEAGNDLPKSSVIQVCNDLARWHRIFILSGRSETTRDVTRKWLRDHNVTYDKLKLRGKDDRTQDDKLKLQWVEEMKISQDVIGVFEDRQRVVDAWRAAGYTCFQVAPGNF
jgi:hypothetical protein